LHYIWLLFGLKGRINRARYLVVQLALLTFWLLWLKFPFQVSSQWETLLFDGVVTIALIWINTATTAKRLHDRDRSGWWAVAIIILNRLIYVYYGLFFGLSFGVDISIAEELLLVMLAVAMSLLGTWVFIELIFLIGTDGSNRFGPDPLARVPTGALPTRARTTSTAFRLFSCAVPALRPRPMGGLTDALSVVCRN
jgi:uncharacterized membrane protein YhaH (DUF805 family)